MAIVSDANCPTSPDLGRPETHGLLDAALVLARKGWFVFPCVTGAKRPALRGWERLATTNPRRIAGWWEHGRCNIGIACGPSRLVVLDLDVPRLAVQAAPGPDGAQRLALLCRQHAQPYPDTFTVSTPSGGQHLYFTSPEQPLRNTAGRLGPLIDTRAAGGYVLGPGSQISGRPYTVISLIPPQPVPPWLASLLTDPDPPSRGPAHTCPATSGGSEYALAALRCESLRVASARAGTRNDTLNRAAFAIGQLVAAGLLPNRLASQTLAEAAEQAGLPAIEARATIRSGMKAGARKPRSGYL